MVKLMIGSPTFGYKCYTPFAEALIRLEKLAAKEDDFEIEYKFMYQESLITRARNTIVSFFLRSDCTHLMFIDSDIDFHPEDVIKLARHTEDIVVGAYPIKHLVRQEGKSDVACLKYAVNLLKTPVPVINNLMEIEYGATGFMMIHRNVIETMIEKYPELKYQNDVPINGEFKREDFHALFDCVIDKESNRYLSEDYTFCKRWRDIGGKIFMDISVNLSHIGTYVYDGSILMKFIEEGIFTPSEVFAEPQESKESI